MRSKRRAVMPGGSVLGLFTKQSEVSAIRAEKSRGTKWEVAAKEAARAPSCAASEVGGGVGAGGVLSATENLWGMSCRCVTHILYRFL